MPQQTAVSPVFVGRAAELATLTEALDLACRGEGPQRLMIGGEAGVGKTRLLREFLDRARATGAVTAVGGCLELGADGLPFAPVTTALRGLHRELGGAELTAASAGRAAELARLLPDLAPPPRGDAAAGSAYEEEDGGRARLFELTAQFLERLAAPRTVVLALEDLQWADRSTRELFGYLCRSLRPSRLVLLATYRTDDIHRRHPLRPFLAEQDRLRTVRRVEVPRLTRAETRAQIAGIQGVTEPENGLVDRVFRRSEGIPFFVEELTESSAGADGEGGEARGEAAGGISASLRDLLLVRVEALPEPAQEVVRLAAGGGSAVEHALLGAVAGLPEEALLDALRAAVGGHVLQPTGSGRGYCFRHALLREAVSDDLLPGEAARISRRYATELEADPALVPEEERATRLAHYWYRGGDAAKALPAVLAASVEARGRHAYAEEHQLLERAVELWDRVPDATRDALPPITHPRTYPAPLAPEGPEGGPPHLVDVLAEAVVAARTGGEAERALALARRALALLDERQDPLRCAWFWGKRALLTEDLGRGDGWRESVRAQELVRGLPPSAVHAEVLANAAAWGVRHRPGRSALALAVRAAELARVVGATAIGLQARISLGTLLAGSGDVEGGLSEITGARDEAARAGVSGVRTLAAVNIAVELETAGRSAESAAEAAHAARLAAERGRPNYLAASHAARAEALHSLGRWEEAAHSAEQARTAARSADVLAYAALVRAWLARTTGDTAALADAVETVGAVVDAGQTRASVREPHKTVRLRLAAMALAAGNGDLDGARAELERALDDGFPPGTHRFAWPLLHAAAAHESRARGLPAAEPGRPGVLERVRHAARHLPRLAPVWEAYALLVDAELTRAEGRADPARWAEATAAFAPLERPYELALARQGQAEALVTDAGGGRPESAELLALAHTTAVRLGAGPLRAEAEQLALRARITLEEAGGGEEGKGEKPQGGEAPADAFRLTRRERDVLALVSEGRSNRQIAERLHISPKTASVHVSRILAKLGVAGRGEAAAMAFRLRLLGPDGEVSPPGARTGG
ncbi:LuxR family transcriptional regulator [Streptomyces albiaxialis]|uniref:LuxR family transcriptional regulator n=1 Tax=Streptomyces albiaxialis TaxID=329523 RepID=A0ABN2WV74_9ACTN